MQHLQQDLAAGVVHRLCDPAMSPHIGGGDHLRGERQQPACAVRRVPAGDDQADTTAGALGEVLGQPIGVAGTILQPGVHRTHHHAVAQGGEAKVQWRQQVWVGAGH
jgi:hypothetical protein